MSARKVREYAEDRVTDGITHTALLKMTSVGTDGNRPSRCQADLFN